MYEPYLPTLEGLITKEADQLSQLGFDQIQKLAVTQKVGLVGHFLVFKGVLFLGFVGVST